jgi:predicted HTH transcriptional regulator
MFDTQEALLAQIRLGEDNSKRKISMEYPPRLGQQRSQTRLIHFDEQPVVQAPVEALSPPLYERFSTSRTRDEELNILRKLGLVALDDQGQSHPSVAGILMACQDPRDWMPNAFIQAVAYHGTSLPAPLQRLSLSIGSP